MLNKNLNISVPSGGSINVVPSVYGQEMFKIALRISGIITNNQRSWRGITTHGNPTDLLRIVSCCFVVADPGCGCDDDERDTKNCCVTSAAAEAMKNK